LQYSSVFNLLLSGIYWQKLNKTCIFFVLFQSTKGKEVKMSDFLCPKCRQYLRVGENIIFKVKNSKKQSALLLLSPQIGNYTSHKHPSFEIQNGESLEFYCPLCNTSLISEIHKNLAQVIMVDSMGDSHNVYFSRVMGEHSTFETDGESVHVAGEDAGRYTYFKIGDKFRKYF
jgi:predicted RNA-binding Zn-ribbon protein involved in translation (DUF1610 family)